MSRAQRIATALAVLACTAGSARAGADEAARAIGLDEAMRVALGNNPALGGKMVDVDVASARVLQATGLDDFLINAGATVSHARGANVLGQPTPLMPYDGVDLNASITRPLSTGGSVALKLDAPYATTAASNDPANGTIDTYLPSVQLALTQPLLRGRGYDVARAPIRQAHAALDVAHWELEAAAALLLRDVSDAYWELSYASGDFALRRASLEAARAQLLAVQAQIQVGKQPPSASAEVEVSIALREDEVLDAESAIPERGAELARLLGFDGQRAAQALRATDRPPVADPPGGAVLARALAQNAQIASLRAQAAAATIDVDVARSGLLPQLDVFASGGPMGAASQPGAALRALGTFGTYGVQAGLVFQEPIERRAQRGARDVATGLVTRARFNEADARARIASDLTIAVTSLEATRRRVDVLARAVEVADLDLAGEQARFQANRSTNFDVLRRQQATTEVRLRLFRAQIDNARAAAALDALTADILPHHGLAVRTAMEAR